jgi:hypothetical protein
MEEEKGAFVSHAWFEETLGHALERAQKEPLDYMFGALCSEIGLSRSQMELYWDRIQEWRDDRKDEVLAQLTQALEEKQ